MLKGSFGRRQHISIDWVLHGRGAELDVEESVHRLNRVGCMSKNFLLRS